MSVTEDAAVAADQYHHEQPFEIDFSQHGPPSPVLWFTCMLDSICSIGLRCSNWREALGVLPSSGSGSGSSWLSYQVPYLSDHFPPLVTYDDYYANGSCSNTDSHPQDNNNNKWSASCLYGYAFQTESTALGDLSTPTACLALLVLVFLLRQIKSVLLPFFRSVGRNAGRQAHGPDWEKDNEIRISKFGEYVFRLLYHSVISAFGIVYFWDKEWWKSTGPGTLSLFAGYPYHPVEPGMAWYYLLQSAYNLDALISLLTLSFTFGWKKPTLSSKRPIQNILPFTIQWSEDVRGDFREMFIHHVVTNLLVVGSSRCRVTRIGSMVFLIHDISDIPVDLSKLANFLKYKIATIACFITMAFVWLVTRLYILPFTIYRAVLTQSHYVLQEGFPPLLYMCYRQPFYVLVGLLILLHLAWFGIFIQIFYTIVAKHECHDYSEHKKGEANSRSSGKQQPKVNGCGKMNGQRSSKLEKSYGDEKKDD